VRLRRIVTGILVGLGSLLAAFFLVFNLLFSDGPTSLVHPERLVSYALVAGAYVILAAAGSHFAGRPWLPWSLGVAAPALSICILYSLREPGIALLAVVYGILALGAALLGGWYACSRWRPLKPHSD
jgi:hypothetical protein